MFRTKVTAKYVLASLDLEFELDEDPRYASGRSGKWYELKARLNAKQVGFVRYKKRPGGFSVIEVFVDEAHRRRGVATAMYDHIESEYGKLFKSKDQTDDGKAFRKARG